LARCLIIACGCRGRSLAWELHNRGHTVRGTTRDAGRQALIEAAGAEPFVGDPDRVATLATALAQVTIVCLLLGSAVGTPAQLASLHGSRLEMLLARMLDTTVRGVIYERAGTVDEALLRRGAQTVRHACQGSRIPFALLEADPRDHGGWLLAATDAVEGLLAPD
jgi:hypothetical protein